MTDINNNYNNDGVNNLPNLSFEGTKRPANHENSLVSAEHKEIKNLDNAHAALVGRSMIKRTKKPEMPEFSEEMVANVKSDLSELQANPKLVVKANALFEAALAKGYPYDKAVAIAREFVDSYKTV